jgi:pimeloyl-ACP methyl ester carboxylesterase
MTTFPNSTRREVVGGATALALGGLATPAQAQSGGKTFVLVHGAWHGGWCWRRVSDLLEKKGHKVFSPTLTGLGERSHLIDAKINLDTHIADVVNVIKWEGLSDIVLVGHSYGGIVVSGVAEKSGAAISSIVFLDAFVPDNGTSLFDAASEATRGAISGAVEKGEMTLKPIPSAVFRVNEKDRAWVDAMCTPQPIKTFTDKVVMTGARDKVAKKAYIRAKGYPSVSFDAALAKSQGSAWRIYEMTAGHDAMVDEPDRLTEILLEVA